MAARPLPLPSFWYDTPAPAPASAPAPAPASAPVSVLILNCTQFPVDPSKEQPCLEEVGVYYLPPTIPLVG